MAGNIAVKNKAIVESWVAKANSLNARAEEQNKLVASLLRQLDSGSAGDIVDTLVREGNNLLEGATQIFNGVTAICKAINEVANVVTDVVGGLVKGVTSIFS